MSEKGRPPGPDDARRIALSIRILPAIREALDRAAKADRRTTAAMAEIILEAGLRDRGYLKG